MAPALLRMSTAASRSASASRLAASACDICGAHAAEQAGRGSRHTGTRPLSWPPALLRRLRAAAQRATSSSTATKAGAGRDQGERGGARARRKRRKCATESRARRRALGPAAHQLLMHAVDLVDPLRLPLLEIKQPPRQCQVVGPQALRFGHRGVARFDARLRPHAWARKGLELGSTRGSGSVSEAWLVGGGAANPSLNPSVNRRTSASVAAARRASRSCSSAAEVCASASRSSDASPLTCGASVTGAGTRAATLVPASPSMNLLHPRTAVHTLHAATSATKGPRRIPPACTHAGSGRGRSERRDRREGGGQGGG